MNRGKLLVVLFAFLLAVMLFNQIAVTPTAISDSDASTYIIVPMLMIPIFALFMVREEIVPDVHGKDILLGILLFAVFVLFTKYALMQLGFAAFSYRIGFLLFPIAIASIATLLFGFSNLRRFSFLAVYSIFASPLLVLPVINLNSSFATACSVIVYDMLKLFIPSLAYSPPITLYFNGISISIGQACVGIGALIGLLLLLLPLAYLYDGRPKDKVAWIVSGVFLLFVFNIIRMSLIAGLWFVNGPSQQLLDVHTFAGEYIFYIAVAVIIIAAGAYRLSYPGFKARRRTKETRHSMLPVIVAIILAMAYYFSSQLLLSNVQIISPVLLANTVSNATFTYQSLSSLLGSVANLQNYSAQSVIDRDYDSAEIFVYNVTQNGSNLILLFGPPNQTFDSKFRSLPYLYKVDAYGNFAKVYQLQYSSNYSFIYYRVVPYENSGAYYGLGEYAILTFRPGGSGTACQSGEQLKRELFTNALYLNFPNATTTANIDAAYCLISKVVK